MSHCTVYLGRTGDKPCPGEVVAHGIKGCVHEHVNEVAHCDSHVESGRAGTLWCRQCLKAGAEVRIQVIYT